LIPRCLVPLMGVQGVGDPKGVSTVASTTLDCPSSRGNCLCGPPLPLLSAGGLNQSLRLWENTEFTCVGRSCVLGNSLSGIKGDSIVSGSRGIGRVSGLDKPNREPTSGLEPLTCSLRVIGHVLQGCAGACKCRIFRGVSFLRLAQCCTVLRSRWYQSGINTALTSPHSVTPR
jgi:hypothetical protein